MILPGTVTNLFISKDTKEGERGGYLYEFEETTDDTNPDWESNEYWILEVSI